MRIIWEFDSVESTTQNFLLSHLLTVCLKYALLSVVKKMPKIFKNNAFNVTVNYISHIKYAYTIQMDDPFELRYIVSLTLTICRFKSK